MECAVLAANIEATAGDYVLQYGIVGLIAIVFGYVIVYLFKRSEAKDEKHNAAMVAAAVEKEALRADYETKHAQALTEFARQLQELRVKAQEREDLIRKEFSDLMERLAEEASKTSEATTAVLHKFYDRILGPRAR